MKAKPVKVWALVRKSDGLICWGYMFMQKRLGTEYIGRNPGFKQYEIKKVIIQEVEP